MKNETHRRAWIPIAISGIVSVALVVTALFLVRGIGAEAYEAYRAKGGANGFWSWFAHDVCGVNLPGVEDRDAPIRDAARQAQAKRKTAAAQAERLAELKAHIAKLEAEEKAAVAMLKKSSRGKGAQAKSASAWSDKNLTVTFSVSDKTYSKELRAQSKAAYESGVAESVNAKIERSRGDYSDRMERAAA